MRARIFTIVSLQTNLRSALFTTLLSVWFLIPLLTIAAPAQFVPLAGLPGVAPQGGSLGDYLNQLYKFLIVVGAILGAVKISVAGAKYALSDIITDKASAKRDIQGVLLGLAILLIPYVVLTVIYSPLTNLNILQNPAP